MRVFEGFQKGVNLGGWISQFDKYDHEHFRTFITEADIADITALGFDHVRVPVDYNVLEDEEGKRLDSGYGYLEKCYSWCRKHNLNMLVDLHECYGYSFDPLKKDMDRERFFFDEDLQARFLRLWTQIAETFKQDPVHVAFEPLNEVVLGSVAEAWNVVLRNYWKTIRAICPDHYLVFGSTHYSHVTDIPLLEKPADDKIVFNFHCYEPLIFTHQGAYWVEDMIPDFRIGYPTSLEEMREASLRVLPNRREGLFEESVTELGPDFFEKIFAAALKKAEEDNAPLYCGEYGVIDLADNGDKIRWLKDIHSVFHKYNIGRALWNYKEKDFGFVDERFAECREEFMKCL
ncbi:MAG: glycoside hydrolase family 5 protein [Lachnospiraceae bacterium]|nr:glycoside hydrolase family 5 protein [Lachnospiraceae bacterium]